MRRVLMTVAIVLFASNVWAGTTCYRSGNQIICREDSVPSINTGSSTNCYQIGNSVRCN